MQHRPSSFATSGSGGGGWRDRPASPPPERPVPVLAIGDEVSHASLGEGVVTGMERDGVVVVRFREDRSERRLMLGYAPLERI